MKSVKVITLIALSSMIMSFKVLPGMLFLQGNNYEVYKSPALVWKSEEINLGNIPQNKPVTVQFEFTNKGTEAVIITNVTPSCGCTGVEYSKKPILANETSTIKATYNAASMGVFTKTITVTLGDDETKVLQIKGTVVAP